MVWGWREEREVNLLGLVLEGPTSPDGVSPFPGVGWTVLDRTDRES